MARILFVEDNIQYQDAISDILKLAGYEVCCVGDANQAIELFKNTEFDLVISDLKMNSIDGMQLLCLLRRYNDQIKVIILTSSEDENDEIKCLDLKANEFLKKSTSINIILKRIKIVLDSKVKVQDAVDIIYCPYENLRIDLRRRKVFKNEVEHKITKREFDLLVYLASNPNKVLSRDRILKDVWYENILLYDGRAVDTYIKKLRSSLDISCIVSIRGIGYEWSE